MGYAYDERRSQAAIEFILNKNVNPELNPERGYGFNEGSDLNILFKK